MPLRFERVGLGCRRCAVRPLNCVGRLLGHTEAMQVTEAQCAVVATQLKKLTVKQIRIADKRYTVCFHSPLARLVGQMSVNPYDKQGTMEGFYALQTERDHGCIVIWCVVQAWCTLPMLSES